MKLNISRREFLKRASGYSLTGMSLMLAGQLLTSCMFSRDQAPAPKAKGHLFYAQKSLGYYFFIIQQEAMRRAAEERGYDFIAGVSNLNASVQMKQIREAIPKLPAAVICDPISSEQDFSAVQDSMARHNIPMAIVDTPGVKGDLALTVTFDNYRGGQMAAQKIIALLIEKYGKPIGSVLNCYGDLSSQAWRLRRDGFEDELRKYPNVRVISKETVGDITKVYDVTYSTLQKARVLDAVHVPSETPARGVYEALKASHKLYPIGNREHIIFVTIDGEPIAHELIKERILDASISQDPIAYAEICVEMLDRYTLNNKPIPALDYLNERYYWQKAKITIKDKSPVLTIPPFEINYKNVEDKRHWANVACNDWGIKYL